MSRLRIGQVAREAGISVETVRYYEQRGLIEAPRRSDAGYREYPASVRERLAFIARGKALGFSLDEVRELLDLQLDADADRAAVKGLVEEKMALIDAKMAELARLRGSLAQLSRQCDGSGSAKGCPILAYLVQGTSEADAP
ncbi:heavy metal-responsive transcriptional regulator [Motiliproteus sp. SC1-56]|uniref:heavy metal-responsive transcriptional regulator n=1 Tax=Motiliproteus sp. SC1-56 TaxID=2799565 RepID=UPI001A8EC752|nr:heavy metal-responsive transcriptional regulator [Motiliproteus sp. SC1-56]